MPAYSTNYGKAGRNIRDFVEVKNLKTRLTEAAAAELNSSPRFECEFRPISSPPFTPTMLKPSHCVTAPIILLVGLWISIANAQTTIFADNFDGSTGNINGVAPDVRPGGETWTASTIFNADGSVDRPTSSSQGSMTLPFIPANGQGPYIRERVAY